MNSNSCSFDLPFYVFFFLINSIHLYLGAYALVYGTFGGEKVTAKIYNRSSIEEEKVLACFDMKKIHFFDVDTTKRIR